MNIVIFSESAYPIINGVSVSTDILSRELVNKGHKVTLICPNNSNTSKEDYSYSVIRTPSIEIVKNYPFPINSKKIIFNLLNSIKPDIIHCQIPFYYGIIAKKWSKENNVPFVTFNHTLYVNYLHYASKFLAPIIKKPFMYYLKKFYNTSDYVLTPSIMMKNELLKYGVNNNIDIIPTGITLPNSKNIDLCNEIKNKYNIQLDDKIIIYLSRIAKEKNVYMLLKAFNEIYKKYKKVTFLICGNGSELEALQNYSKSLDIKNKIIFTGMIKKSEVNNYLYIGDIFAFSSYTETQGLAVCEAMSCGLGVVAVNEGGVPESIINNYDGILTNNDYIDFSNKILDLLNNNDKLNYLKNNARESAKKFTIENMINKYISLYEKAIKENKNEG